jgi:predicted nucleic acid-binding protein
MPSIFTLLNFSLTNKISAFDASYILLAIDNGATLLTNDLQMKRIAEKHNVKVIGA